MGKGTRYIIVLKFWVGQYSKILLKNTLALLVSRIGSLVSWWHISGRLFDIDNIDAVEQVGAF